MNSELFSPDDFTDFDRNDRPMLGEWVRVREIPNELSERRVRLNHGPEVLAQPPARGSSKPPVEKRALNASPEGSRAPGAMPKALPFVLLSAGLVAVGFGGLATYFASQKASATHEAPSVLVKTESKTVPVLDRKITENGDNFKFNFGATLDGEKVVPNAIKKLNVVVTALRPVKDLERLGKFPYLKADPKKTPIQAAAPLHFSEDEYLFPFSFVAPPQAEPGGDQVEIPIAIRLRFMAHFRDESTEKVDRMLNIKFALPPPPEAEPNPVSQEPSFSGPHRLPKPRPVHSDKHPRGSPVVAPRSKPTDSNIGVRGTPVQHDPRESGGN